MPEYPLHVIILAAGEGTRMRSRRPKVLQSLAGRPMLAHVVDTARALSPAAVHVVYGAGGDAVPAAIGGDDLQWVLQAERLGTAHAVQTALPGVPEPARVLVLNGDHPLIPAAVLATLLDSPAGDLALLTMRLEDPAAYGRVLRDDSGAVRGVVEFCDASDAQRDIDEVNTGILAAPRDRLGAWLERVDNDNAQREYYLPDVIGQAVADGVTVHGIEAPEPADLAGANDRAQLAALERRLRQRRAADLLDAGVQLADPDRCDVRGTISAGRDVFIDVNVVLEGRVELGDGVSLGPGSVVRDCRLAAGTRVHAYCVLDGVRTEGACDIGPYARLRPGTDLAAGCRIGNFVETKQATFGAESRANHLSYVGDAEIGERVNIGAGTITCNYDGARKHRTVIGDDVFIGSDSQLVAPVEVGAGATVGAGTTLTADAPAGQLTLGRSRQVTVEGWQRPRKERD